MNKPKTLTIVPEQLQLPLLLLTKHSLRLNQPNAVKNYLLKQHKNCASYCRKENLRENTATNKLKRLLGLELQSPKTSSPRRVLNFPRDDLPKPWSLSPNMYFKPTKSKPFLVMDWALSEKKTEKRVQKEKRSKNVALERMRANRRKARTMSRNSCGCRHVTPPYGPKPIPIEELEKAPRPSLFKRKDVNTFSKVVKADRPNPHIFLPHSCVPARTYSYEKKDTSFSPGPGTYETQIPIHCPCPRFQTPMYNMKSFYEKQKRRKFLGEQYVDINPDRYCAPEWRHIKGQGFPHLFKNALKQAEVTYRRYSKMHSNLDYFQRILDPRRVPLSFHEEEFDLPPNIHFNTDLKHISKRSKQYERKSHSKKMEHYYKALQARASASRSSRKSIPPDQKIMRVPRSQIKSKILECPKRRKPDRQFKLTTAQMKFSPLPEPKKLLKEDDLNAILKPGIHYWIENINLSKFTITEKY